jgi:hypothetical protein
MSKRLKSGRICVALCTTPIAEELLGERPLIAHAAP